jgi:hypothetical protein
MTREGTDIMTISEPVIQTSQIPTKTLKEPLLISKLFTFKDLILEEDLKDLIFLTVQYLKTEFDDEGTNSQCRNANAYDYDEIARRLDSERVTVYQRLQILIIP